MVSTTMAMVIDEGYADSDSDGIADCVDVEECDGLDNDGIWWMKSLETAILMALQTVWMSKSAITR